MSSLVFKAERTVRCCQDGEVLHPLLLAMSSEASRLEHSQPTMPTTTSADRERECLSSVAQATAAAAGSSNSLAANAARKI